MTNINKGIISLPLRSQYSSREKWERACWQKLLNSKPALNLLTTFNERRNIVTRAAVINFMNSGKKFQEIVRELQLSPQTVSSIKKAIKERSYKSYRERGKIERKKKVYSHYANKKEKGFDGRRYRRTKYGKFYF